MPLTVGHQPVNRTMKRTEGIGKWQAEWPGTQRGTRGDGDGDKVEAKLGMHPDEGHVHKY
jgi:hypothetical protein